MTKYIKQKYCSQQFQCSKISGELKVADAEEILKLAIGSISGMP